MIEIMYDNTSICKEYENVDVTKGVVVKEYLNGME